MTELDSETLTDRQFGHRYAVCRSIDDVTETLREWGWI